MRLIIKFSSIEKAVPISYFINKFTIQGFFYYLFLLSEKLKYKHEEKGIKFFCFSDVFMKDNYYYLLFSSPSKEIVNEVYSVLKKLEYFYIGYTLFKKESVKKINLKIGKRIQWETGSPVVVYYKDRPFSFVKDKEWDVFFQRLRENAIKKFEIFYGEKIEIDEIFDRVEFKKSVSIPLQKDERKFLIFGSTWKLLEKSYVGKNERRFYKFIMDAGIGEKNSLGFGFVSPKKDTS